MLSGKLIRLIETHEESIGASVLRSIRRDPGLQHLARALDADLNERRRELITHLGHWLAHGHEEEIAVAYESLGKRSFDQDVPLEETVAGLALTKAAIFDFLDEQGIDPDTLTLYAETQMLRRIGQFFDLLTCRLVRGYERARRRAVHAT